VLLLPKRVLKEREPSSLRSPVPDHLFGGHKQNTSKNRERDGVSALDGRHWIEDHNNHLKVSGSSGGGGIGGEVQLGQNVWGIAKPLFRPSNRAAKI
jgi:hypothetical protein